MQHARSETPEDGGGGGTPRAVGDPLRALGLGSSGAAFLVVVPIAAYAHANLWYGPAWLALIATGAATVALAAGLYRAFALGLLIALELAASLWPRLWGWPQGIAVPLAVWAAAVLAVPQLREGQGWLRRGRFDRTIAAWIAAIIVVSSSALIIWFYALRPDVSGFARALPHWSLGPMLAAAVGFAVLNAAIEETIWRGVMMTAVADAFGSVAIAVLVQTASFGMAHLHGFPRGWLGAGMAASYGLMLGLLRVYTGGMLAPFVAHVFADLTIFGILMTLVR